MAVPPAAVTAERIPSNIEVAPGKSVLVLPVPCHEIVQPPTLIDPREFANRDEVMEEAKTSVQPSVFLRNQLDRLPSITWTP